MIDPDLLAPAGLDTWGRPTFRHDENGFHYCILNTTCSLESVKRGETGLYEKLGGRHNAEPSHPVTVKTTRPEDVVFTPVVDRLIDEAASLIDPDSPNPEYERALSEVIAGVAGDRNDFLGPVEKAIRHRAKPAMKKVAITLTAFTRKEYTVEQEVPVNVTDHDIRVLASDIRENEAEGREDWVEDNEFWEEGPFHVREVE